MTTTHQGAMPKDPKAFTGRTVLFWLFGFFAVIFAANAVFIWLAVGSFPGVVVESSYTAGQTYNQEIADAKAQSERGWQVKADLTRAANGGASLKVEARDKLGAPLTGLAFVAHLNHPTHDGVDLDVALVEGESGVYTGTADALAAGNWNMVLDAESADERLFRSENRIFLSE
ncbi:FixH family protein [uncultured Roseibium sp.]|uniref:FixH family protein n=1 Tax=uncultured Roseibium sp. TaxID=1936171 RepID=UPI002591A929|nr:FixH family protein [uncultured Roseibium sp.]